MGREAWAFHGEGLAPFLSSRGWDVFVLELPANARFRDQVEVILPAAVDTVQSLHAGRVVLGLHGHGGAVALAACGHELLGRVAGVVGLDTPVEWELPNAVLGGVLAAGGRFGALAGEEGRATLGLLFTHGAWLGSTVRERFAAEGLRDLSPAVADEWLSALHAGAPPLPGPPFAERLARLDIPILAVLGARDTVAHPEHVTPLRERAPRARVTFRELNRFQGAAEDYTHLSLLLGAGAPRDVFHPVAAWLERLP
jgi:pimeloyl-ACP methyl ester carboxylesterase